MRYYCVFNTEYGFIGLIGENGKLCRSTLPMRVYDEAVEAIQAGLSAESVEDIAAFGDLPGRLKHYFSGEKVDFSDVPIDVSCQSPFYGRAQLVAQKVPYGQLITYKDLARMAGKEKAARAAGTAMARNLLPIIIPCHRVVASGRKIGGFSLGLEWKHTLLRIEGVDI